MSNRILVVLSLVALTGCTTAKFSGKVVSCADQKPIEEANIKWTSKGPNNNMGGSMPRQTKKDGTYRADVTLAEGNPVTLTVEKAGFKSKEETLTAGADQQICLEPAK